MSSTTTSYEILAPTEPRAPIVAHIPHASISIPAEFRRDILLDDAALGRELARMTDWHTDRLFDGLRALGATAFVNRLSRLVVDPERFEDDAHEPNAAVGHGAVYTRTADGVALRAISPAERQRLIERIYRPYHAALTDLVAGVLAVFGECLILDCHSFFSVPLPNERDQTANRPDICIGTDPFHTPPELVARLVSGFRAEGLRVEVDRPFTGALVPMAWYGHDRRVSAVMIEVRRGLYCEEATGKPGPTLRSVGQAIVRTVSRALSTGSE